MARRWRRIQSYVEKKIRVAKFVIKIRKKKQRKNTGPNKRGRIMEKRRIKRVKREEKGMEGQTIKNILWLEGGVPSFMRCFFTKNKKTTVSAGADETGAALLIETVEENCD